MKRRIALASSAMWSLRRIWSDRYLCLPTKFRVYQTLVRPILTYACETWTLLEADIKRLEAFHMKMSTTNSQDPLAGLCVEHRRFLPNRSWSCAGFNRPSSQLTLWTCSQTSRGHTCSPSLAVPHRSVTRSPSRPKLDWIGLSRV